MEQYIGPLYYKNKNLEDIPGEGWNDIPGYDGLYQASTLGRIKSCERIDASGRYRKAIIRSQCINSCGVLGLPLYAYGKSISWQVSNLVWMAFNGFKDKDGLKIAHINKNKIDNRLCNLTLQTQSKVCGDSFLLGVSTPHTNDAFLSINKVWDKFDLENGNRICTKCLAEKPISEFYSRRGVPSGKNRRCRDCLLIYEGVSDVGKSRFFKELNNRGLKKCKKCDTIKSFEQFPKRKITDKNKNGIGAYCTSCEGLNRNGVKQKFDDLFNSGLRNCPVCKTVKPFSEFYKSNKLRGGLNYVCRSCQKIKNAEQWQKRKARGLKK